MLSPLKHLLHLEGHSRGEQDRRAQHSRKERLHLQSLLHISALKKENMLVSFHTYTTPHYFLRHSLHLRGHSLGEQPSSLQHLLILEPLLLCLFLRAIFTPPPPQVLGLRPRVSLLGSRERIRGSRRLACQPQ